MNKRCACSAAVPLLVVFLFLRSCIAVPRTPPPRKGPTAFAEERAAASGIKMGLKKGTDEIQAVKDAFRGVPLMERDEGQKLVSEGAEDLRGGVEGLMDTLHKTDILTARLREELDHVNKMGGAAKGSTAEAAQAAKELSQMQADANKMDSKVLAGTRLETLGGFEIRDANLQMKAQQKGMPSGLAQRSEHTMTAAGALMKSEFLRVVPDLEKEFNVIENLTDFGAKLNDQHLPDVEFKLEKSLEKLGNILKLQTTTEGAKGLEEQTWEELTGATSIPDLRASFPGPFGPRWSASLQSYSDAYILCYPAVLMNQTMQRWPARNIMVHKVDYAQFSTDIVAPNLDAIQSSAFLDVTEGPVVFSVPKLSQDAYYVAQFMDYNTNTIASIGTRTTGMDVNQFVLTWKENYNAQENITYVANFKGSSFYQINTPTKWVWVIVRMFPRSEEDMEEMQKLQRQFTITPWAAYVKHGHKVVPSRGQLEKDHSHLDSPPKQVALMGSKTFYQTCAKILAAGNPPTPADEEVDEVLKGMGIRVGDPEFKAPGSMSKYSATIMSMGYRLGLARVVMYMLRKRKERINGWLMSGHENGDFGKNYMYRAGIAMFGLGANMEEDAVYCNHDLIREKTLHTITFPKQPPVTGFWSLSLYTPDLYFYPNKDNRNTISTRDHETEQDGSIEIIVGLEKDKPENAKNFLAAPPDKDWKLVVRLYWPESDIIDRKYKLPPVVDTGEGGDMIPEEEDRADTSSPPAAVKSGMFDSFGASTTHRRMVRAVSL